MDGGDRRMSSTQERWSYRWGPLPSSVAPYVPTPIQVVRRMLELAEAGEDDVVYDLGCGDGRILFTAVEEFGVKKAVGYELNASMCESIMRRVRERGLEGRIEVVNGNLFLADLREASIVTLYLTTSGNSKLRPKLEEELRPGARVVSHDFPIRGWRTVKGGYPDHYSYGTHRIYVYRVPDAFRVVYEDSGDDRWRRLREIFLRLERGSQD